MTGTERIKEIAKRQGEPRDQTDLNAGAQKAAEEVQAPVAAPVVGPIARLQPPLQRPRVRKYADEGAEAYENRYRQQRIKSLASRAKELGYRLTSVTA